MSTFYCTTSVVFGYGFVNKWLALSVEKSLTSMNSSFSKGLWVALFQFRAITNKWPNRIWLQFQNVIDPKNGFGYRSKM